MTPAELDALIERLLKRLLKSCKACPECVLDRSQAAAAITELRAEVARLTTKCKYGDPMCPCQDGDACHYEGDNPMTPPPIAALKARIAELERERDPRP